MQSESCHTFCLQMSDSNVPKILKIVRYVARLDNIGHDAQIVVQKQRYDASKPLISPPAYVNSIRISLATHS